MQKTFTKVFDNSFTEIEHFSLSLSSWPLPVFCWAVLYSCIIFLFGSVVAFIFSAIIFLTPFFFIKIKKTSIKFFVLIIFLLISIFLRLAFLQRAILPSYFDSAEHYLRIKDLLHIYSHQSLLLFWSNYYHIGYHIMSAALIQLFQVNIADFILVFGQVVLAVLPISFFFLIKKITGSNAAAFFTCLVAGFGFHMPSHLINWGKYPALLSLLGIQFVLCLSYVGIKNNISGDHKTKISWLIIFSVFITSLVHTRALIVFGLMVFAYFFTLQLKQISIYFRYLAFGLILFAIGVEIFYVQQTSALAPLFERYIQNDIKIIMLVLLVSPFTIKAYPTITLFLFISFFLFIFSLFFSIHLFDYNVMTLLDRPYVQMLTYLPLSILSGVGFAGFIQKVQSFSDAKLLIPISSFILFGFIVLNANSNQDFYPSTCCQLVNHDDLSAMTWIEKNTAKNSLILIAATQLYVTSYKPNTAAAAVDAGIWITPLTSRVPHPEFHEVNFETFEAHTKICYENVDYIYVGNKLQSFNQVQLDSQPNWYQPIFLLPSAQIYQVIGCE